MSSADRLSVRTTLRNKTGTVLGVVFTAIFIILCFIIFIDPVINYFKGDIVQTSFEARSLEDLKLYTECDFKLAISFVN